MYQNGLTAIIQSHGHAQRIRRSWANNCVAKLLHAILLAFLGTSSACSGHNDATVPSATSLSFHEIGSPTGKVRHVIIVVQSGRTFENIFAGWPGADAPTTGVTHTGRIVKLRETTYRQDRAMQSSFESSKSSWHGGEMNGFDLNHFVDGNNVGLYPYSYLRHDDISPYRQIAAQYVLADRMFPTEFGGSFTSLQDLIATGSFITPERALADEPDQPPWGCDAPQGTLVPVERLGEILPKRFWVYPCVTQYSTLVDLLDNSGVSWKFYVDNLRTDYSGLHWSAFDAIDSVRHGRDWRDDIESPASTILSDAASGNLSSVSWIVPKIDWSDDPVKKSDMGPSWVAAVVNAIGEGPDWDSSVVIIVWSAWGGWYDDAAPPQPTELQLSGLGIRVPCLIVSPYAKSGVVDHRTYEFGSIARFIEESFKLPTLQSLGRGYVFTDNISNSIAHALDFRIKPRPFQPIQAKYPPSTFLQP